MKKRKICIDGFMTVEASFILPLTILLFVFIIYVGFFMYNKCCSVQNCYIAALRGSQQKNVSQKALEIYVNKNIEELLRGRLISVSNETMEVEVSFNQIQVSYSSRISSVIPQLRNYGADVFLISTSQKAKIINPTNYIRIYERLK